MMKGFWSEGLFCSMDERYFRLIDRSKDMQDEIEWPILGKHQVFDDFKKIFNNPSNVEKEAYFDKMTHFDFKCQLPALLQVEDRTSMAHGLESRVPFLDHPLIEFVATIPADVKFQGGNMKYLLKKTFANQLPNDIINRRDKMGFPVPLKEWFDNELHEFAMGILRTMVEKNRPYINSHMVMNAIEKETYFSRKTWALLNLELWYQQFHDQSVEWKSLSK